MRSAEYLRAAACAALIVIILLTFWFASDIFLMAFAGVLLAIVLRSISNAIARITHFGSGPSLLTVIVLFIAVVTLAARFIAPKLSAEIDQLRSNLPPAWREATAWLNQNQWSGDLLKKLQHGAIWRKPVVGRLFHTFSSLASAAGGILVVFVVGLYFAADPALYKRGVLKLIPKAAQHRAAEVLHRTGDQLRYWLLGKLSLMAFVAVCTAVGLWLLHIPLILSLAALAALLDFIPNIGPILSAVPAVVIAFAQSPTAAMKVAGLYVAVQVVESYLLAPLVFKRAVSLPPSITLISQVLIGSFFGILGLILATPLTVAISMIFQMVYVEDILKKDPSS